jgi:hypothetical protein
MRQPFSILTSFVWGKVEERRMPLLLRQPPSYARASEMLGTSPGRGARS